MPPTVRLPTYRQVRRVAAWCGFSDTGQGKGDREKWRHHSNGRWTTIDGHNSGTVNVRDFRLMCEQMGIVDEDGHADFDHYWAIHESRGRILQENPEAHAQSLRVNPVEKRGRWAFYVSLPPHNFGGGWTDRSIAPRAGLRHCRQRPSRPRRFYRGRRGPGWLVRAPARRPPFPWHARHRPLHRLPPEDMMAQA